MRLDNYLVEDDSNVKKLIISLNKNCGQYQRICNKGDKNILYRGTNQDIKDFIVKIPRIDREPRNTDIYYHNLFNKAFFEIFGWRARSRAIFVTSEIKVIKQYGNPYMVIPFDGFKFLWSPKIKDLYNFILNDDFLSNMENDVKHYKYVENIVKNDYKETNFKTAMLSGHEIMINCSKYYLINMMYEKAVKQWIEYDY